MFRPLRLLHPLRIVLIAAAAATMGAPGALAQTGLPGLPPVELPTRLPERPLGAVDDLTRDTLDRADRTLAETRQARIRDLLRLHRRELERGPGGEPIVRSEVLAVDLSVQAREAARRAGFAIVRERPLGALGGSVTVLRAPPGTSTAAALRRLRRLDPGGLYDFNNIHIEAGVIAGEIRSAAATGAAAQGGAARAGLIDGGVDAHHPAFAPGSVLTRGFQPQGIAVTAHATGVASILTGSGPGFSGAAPGARLYAADVFGGAPAGGATDAIAAAMAWMAQEEVGVIAISLVGPSNIVLEAVVRRMQARGHILVAAVGNDGPAARPLYPAAYPGVIAVTGVDGRDRVLVEAGRGDHVDLAAPGADVSAAMPGGGYSAVRGTSFAAPVAAGLMAQRLPRPHPESARAAREAVFAQAVDLGARGRDRIYGEGLVGGHVRNSRDAARLAGR